MVLDPDDLLAMADEELSADKYGRRVLSNQAANVQADHILSATNVDEQPTQLVVNEAPAPMQSNVSKDIEPPTVSRQEQMMSELKDLQARQRNMNMWAGIADASARAGQAIAGQVSGNFEPTGKAGDVLRGFGKLGVDQYNDRVEAVKKNQAAIDEQDLNDPNSARSKQAAELLKQSGYDVKPGMTAKGMEDYRKMLGDYQGLKQGSQKVAAGELSATDSAEARDPNSTISKAYQAAATKLGMKPESVQGKTAHDLEKILKVYKEAKEKSESFIPQAVYDPKTGQTTIAAFSSKTGQMAPTNSIKGYAPKTDLNTRTGEKEIFVPGVAKSLGNAYAGATPAPTADQAPGLTRGNLDVEQGKRLDKAREDMSKDDIIKDETKAVNSAEAITSLLETGQAMDGDILRAVQTKFARASGEAGAMTEQDVAPYGGRQAVLDRIRRSASVWATGKIPETDREFLMNLANTMKNRSRQNIEDRTQYYVKNMTSDLKSSSALNKGNFGEAQVGGMLGADTLVGQPATVKVRNKETGQTGSIPGDKAQAAVASGKYELVK